MKSVYQLRNDLDPDTVAYELRAIIDECRAMTGALLESKNWAQNQTIAYAAALDRKLMEVSELFGELEQCPPGASLESQHQHRHNQALHKSNPDCSPRSPQLLTSQQAAEYLNLSTAFLERDRWAGARVPFIKVGTRSIRYRIEDLQRFIESRVMRSTSEYE